MLALLCTIVQEAWAWDGSGTQTDPYKIQTSADWKQLSDEVGGGNHFDGKCFEMTVDIEAEGISIGSETKPFSGTFDGGNHTLTYNAGTVGRYAEGNHAPFISLSGATIKNLKVAGYIYSTSKYSAGLACYVDGSKETSVTNCSVLTRLFGSYDLNEGSYFGGFVAEVKATCTATLSFKDCSFQGILGNFTSYSACFVGYTPAPVSFNHCVVDPYTVYTRLTNTYTFVRAADNVKCTLERCCYTQAHGVAQGEAVFRTVTLPKGFNYQIEGEADENYNGTEYWKTGTWITIEGPAVAGFNHWDTGSGGCFVSNPMTQNGSHQLRDIHGIPTLTASTNAIKAKMERTMDGTRYRYLGKDDYHLYLSDETCQAKGYKLDSDGWLYKDINGTDVWVTAVVGWESGKIPSDGAQIHNDLVGDWRDHSLMAVIAPHAFMGCTELKTLYFKDTDANNYNTKTPFDFQIGDSAFANCPNLTEIKMMQYTTKGTNHWEALSPGQVSSVGSGVLSGSPQAYFSTDASEYQNYLASATWKDYQNRIIVYNHTNVDMTVNGAKYSYMRNTKGEPLKNSADGNAELMQSLRLWNADYQEFACNMLLANSDENIWYTYIVGCDDSYLKSNDGVMRIYNDPGSYYNYKTIAIGRNAFKGSKELKAIEFWQTNGRSENSYTDMKMVIQNGAFYDCPNLKELRMYYYAQDGDDHWTVLGPKDVIPSDNIFGLPTDDEIASMTQDEVLAFPKVNEDFQIVVSPELYNDFINDPNWGKYFEYIVAADYERSNWDAIETDGLTYNYASKTAGGAATNQVVTQNLSWWNVPIKIYEAITLYQMIQSFAEIDYATMWKEFSGKMKLLSTSMANNKNMITEQLAEGAKLTSTDVATYTSAVDYQLGMGADNAFVPDSKLAQKAIEANIIYKPADRYVWTAGAREKLLGSAANRELLQKSYTKAVYKWVGSVNRDALVATRQALHGKIGESLNLLDYTIRMNGAFGGAYAALQALHGEMSDEEFQRGLVENIKANIHNVSYENTMVYTPDKKLIYHVYVDHINDIKRDSLTIYHDIGRAWNYRTVGVKKSAFQGNTHIQKIGFAENAVAGSDTYVPMQLAIPDSAFAGCTSLTRFNLIYKTRKGGYLGLGPENFILGGDSIFAGCDSTKLQIVIPEDRKQDFLADEMWNKYKRFFVYETTTENTEYTEYGVNYNYYYDNNTTQRVSKVSGHKIEHLTAISADNKFLDEHQGSMGLFNDIGSFNNYKLDLVKKKAFAGNDHLKTVSFWDLNGGDSYTTLDVTLGDSCFIPTVPTT